MISAAFISRIVFHVSSSENETYYPPFCVCRPAPARHVAILGLCASLSLASPAHGKEILFEGCEAADARHLLDNASQMHWQSEWRRLGSWRFASEASINCGSETCIVSTRLSYLVGDKPSRVEADGLRISGPVLPHHGRDGNEHLVFKREIAADLREAIRGRSYKSSSIEIVTVWMDYGTLADQIRVRSRTAISCRLDKNHCAVESNIIAFVSYDEHHECGYLGIGDDLSEFLY